MTDVAETKDIAGARAAGYRTKLIEVALPLEAINAASAWEKKIRHGTPGNLHLWWARRPLAACRAVLFAQLVDDPSAVPEEFRTEEAQAAERERLFGIIERLVVWENSTNAGVLFEARREIARSVARAAGVERPETSEAVEAVLHEHAPPVLDPFCGGGSIPLEAQRLGLEALGSDLNPVAVLITKALVDIPPRFAGRPPVNPRDRAKIGADEGWNGTTGLAADVRFYGEWMREEAHRRIGHLYPKAKLPSGGEATVIAWLWARTVTCPNPACGARMPLVRSFALSTKKGKETTVEPVIDRAAKTVRFEIKHGGKPPDPPKIGRGATFRCLVCSDVAPDAHVKAEAKAGRIGTQLMAMVAEGRGGRIYLAPTVDQEQAAKTLCPDDVPEAHLADDPRNIWCAGYGLDTFDKLFTPRQLVALTTFSDLVGEARERTQQDAVAAGLPNDGVPLHEGGSGATAYGDAVSTYLAFAVDKAADRNSALCAWQTAVDHIRNTFGRQALPMVWDFAEANPLGHTGGGISGGIDSIVRALDSIVPARTGKVRQADAARMQIGRRVLISTDPPYYDNIGYADLSDFFYVWLRRSLRAVYPDLFRTLLVPKAEELVATPYRFGGNKRRAEEFFEHGLGEAFDCMRGEQDEAFPITVYYAFKQTESSDDTGTVSTGWETMLSGLLNAGLSVLGTWPMRSELSNRMIASGANALASSIVLVCRPRPRDARIATRREFINALRAELPDALAHLRQGAIAPVDLPQAAIGPGMRVFSRYARVIEADGAAMPVRAALGLINQILYEVQAESTADFDAETRWALAWFEQFGTAEGKFGEAETMFKAMNTSEGALREARVAEARAGKVRLLRRDELPPDWEPLAAQRVTVWGLTQALIVALDRSGESGAATLIRRAGGLSDAAQVLAYALYLIAERKGWTEEGIAYNSLAVAWPELTRLAATVESGQIGLGV